MNKRAIFGLTEMFLQRSRSPKICRGYSERQRLPEGTIQQFQRSSEAERLPNSKSTEFSL